MKVIVVNIIIILIKNDFLKHKQANINVESRRRFRRHHDTILKAKWVSNAKIWFILCLRISIITKDHKFFKWIPLHESSPFARLGMV